MLRQRPVYGDRRDTIHTTHRESESVAGNSARFNQVLGSRGTFTTITTDTINGDVYPPPVVESVTEIADLSDADTTATSLALGQSAGVGSGTDNVAVGIGAMVTIGTGSENTVVGASAAPSLSTGTGNVCLGNQSDVGAAIDDAVVVGKSASVSSNSGIAVGPRSACLASAVNSIAIGVDSEATGDNGIALGESSTAPLNSIMIGASAGQGTYTGGLSNCIGVGNSTFNGSTGTAVVNCVAVGHNASPSMQFENNTAVGANTLCALFNDTSIGQNARCTSHDSVSIGHNSTAIGNRSVAIGIDSISNHGGSVAIGFDSVATSNGTGSIAIGPSARASQRSISLGNTAGARASQNAERNIAIGEFSMGLSTKTSNCDFNVCVGCDSGERMTSGSNNVMLGDSAGDSCTTGSENTCVGSNSGSVFTTSAGNSLLGRNSTSTADYAVGVGHSASVTGTNGISVGRTSSVTAIDAIAIGREAVSSADSGLAIGRQAIASAANAVALGQGASASVADTCVINCDSGLFPSGALYLPTTGGAQSALDHYEEDTTSYDFSSAFTVNQSASIRIVRIGRVCHLSISAVDAAPQGGVLIQAASSVTNLPARFRPVSARVRVGGLQAINNGSPTFDGAVEIATDGSIAVYASGGAGFSPAGGNNGWEPIHVSYHLL